MTLLALDGGGSSTKWGLFHGDRLTGEGRAGPLNGHSSMEATEAVLDGVAASLPARPAALVAGVSGLQDHAAPALRAVLCAAFGLPPETVWLTSDLLLAYHAHFRPGEGLVVYAGTGSVACALDADGRLRRAGGHGPLLGDEGGAFSQGRAALRLLLARQDRGEQLSGPLAELLAARLGGLGLGGLDWPTIRARVYGPDGGRAFLGTLAPLLEQAAAAGDAGALEAARQAGQQLAALARSLGQQVGQQAGASLPVALCGGAANPLVRAAFVAALPGWVHLPPQPPILGGPALYAALGGRR